MKIEIWSDIACPWCYIGKRRFESALESFEHRDEVEITWRSFQLDPSIPANFDGTELEYLSKRKGMPVEQVRKMLASMTDEAAREGLSFQYDRLIVANSFSAHRLIHLAQATGFGDAAKERILAAHFEQGEDIADVDVLSRIGMEIGLDGPNVQRVLNSQEYAEEVRADIAEAGSLGISGVPFFVLDRKFGISGAQPVDVFSQALREAWNDTHPLVMAPSAGPAETCGPDGCTP